MKPVIEKIVNYIVKKKFPFFTNVMVREYETDYLSNNPQEYFYRVILISKERITFEAKNAVTEIIEDTVKSVGIRTNIYISYFSEKEWKEGYTP